MTVLIMKVILMMVMMMVMMVMMMMMMIIISIKRFDTSELLRNHAAKIASTHKDKNGEMLHAS